jgi:NhaP-type Na+/H+ or K+/H+ antiporter
MLVGLALARIVLPLWARLREPTIVITFSVLIPYAVYILTEEVLHVSGILAVVAYGLYQGWKSPRLFPAASTRLQAVAFWGVLVFLLEALLFVLLGQQLPSILSDIEEYSVWEILFYAALVYAAVVLVRFAWFFTTPYFHPVFDRLLHSRYLRAPWQERLVMSWSGMRGAVSLAAALAVPLSTEAGDPFPGRDLIVFLTFSVILATLVLQGLTLGPLISALRLRGNGEASTLAEVRARLEAARAALDRLERLGEGRVSPESQDRMREYYEESIQRYTAGLQAGGTTEEYAKSSRDWRDWRRELLAAEREAILSLRDEGKISPEVMRRIERDLDLQESRLGG